MAFQPPLFSKFGKSFSDLVKKKFDYKHNLTHKDKVDNMSIETGLSANDAGPVGKVQVLSTHGFGECEFNLETDGSVLDFKGKHTKLTPGLNLQLTANGVRQSAQLLSEYRRDNLSGSVQVDGSFDDTKINGSLALGHEGFAVGGSATYRVPTSQLEDYNAGAEYSTKDYTATVMTKDRASVLSFSYFHNLTNRTPGLKTQFGANVEANLHSPVYNLTIAGEHQVNKDIAVKASANTKGTVAAYIEHRLENPQLKVAFSAQWALAKKSSTPDRFGVGLTLGDS
jgi:hypothetical protein